MRSRTVAGRAATLLLGTLLAGCATAPPATVPRASARLGDPEVRAVAALVRMEDRREYNGRVLAGAARAPHAEVRRRAALAAGRLRRSEAVPLLGSLLGDADTAVAATAAFALGQIGDTAALPALVPWVAVMPSRDAPTVAAEAASALGKLRSDRAEQALTAFLSTAPAPPGRSAAVEHALLAVWRHPRPADLQPILRWTEAADPELRWRAAYALVRRPSPAATPRLLELATDADARVRAQALRGLGAAMADSAGLARSAVLPVLLAATEDPDLPTAVNAVRALGSYTDPTVAQRLYELLDADPARAVASAESLGRLGRTAAGASPSLQRVARDPARQIGAREAALQALTRVDPATAASVASGLAEEPGWRARAAAGRALAVLAPTPRADLIARVRDVDPRAGAATLQAAVDAAGDDVAPLRDLLVESVGASDVQLRTAALNGLARLRDPATMPLLLDALARAQRDTLNDAALAALDALAALRQHGTPVDRLLSRRFGRPADPIVHGRALERFGEAVRAAWGDPLPIRTELRREDYEALVRRWVVPVVEGDAWPRARIETESGAIELRLFAAEAPLTVASFLELAEQGYFDGQEWPRVVPNFVIQGGDPRGDQTGGPGYAIRDELNRHRYGRGTLGMALSGPDTGGSQFFITHSPQPHLDGGYTVFGEVVAGMETVERVVVGERISSVRRVH